MKKVYFSGAGNFAKVESFVKGEKNLFYARSHMPGTYIWGMLLTAFYTLMLLWLTYRGFVRNLSVFPLVKKEPLIEMRSRLSVSTGFLMSYVVYDDRAPGYLYRFLSGTASPTDAEVLKLDIKRDGELLQAPGTAEPFVYIIRPEEVPGDIIAGDFLRFVTGLLGYSESEKLAIEFDYLTTGKLQSRIEKLTLLELGELLSITLCYKRKELYVVNDLCLGMTVDFIIGLTEKMEQLADQEAGVVYLTSETPNNILEWHKNPVSIAEAPYWSKIVQTWKGKSSGLRDLQSPSLSGIIEKPDA